MASKGKKKVKQNKHGLNWIKQTLTLDENHGWQCPEGYQVFVAGRGAVRIDVPQGWKLEPKEKSFRFVNAPEPNDDCALEVSFNLLPPELDLKDFPLAGIVKKLAREDSRDVISLGEVVKLKRQTAKIVWIELKFMDHQEGDREAYSRICVGIGSGVQCLITCEFWADEAEQFTPVWDHVLESLVLGLFIDDPRTGFARPD
ncbi:MAG: hypothetical protein HC824_14305 [Synechococcales cyanobacterium RM1_1_8]|nr:hypothetical protein [Synechococcales cyanobacterium RM1_1_8]